MYDEASQRLTEYTFAIDNSKMELRYAEGKVSDAGMAAFYNKAARTLPQNSEAWRNMKMLAAQYADRAKTAGGGGGGAGAAGAGVATTRDANRIPQKKEVAYDTMMGLLTEVARAEGILNTKRETLADLRVAEGDASRLVELLNILNTDPRYADDRERNTAYIRQWGNPNFSGEFTWDTMQAEKVNKNTGITSRLTKAQKAGHATDVKKFSDEMADADEVFNAVTAASPLARYEDARKARDIAFEGETSTPLDKWLSQQTYVKSLQGIHADMAGEGLTDTKSNTAVGHLNNEILALLGDPNADLNAPTLMEDSRGVVAGYRQEGGGEAQRGAEVTADLFAQVEMLVNGTGVNVRVDDDGQPTDDPDAPYGVMPIAKVEGGVAWVPTGGTLPKSIEFGGQTVDISGVMTAVIPTRVFTTPTGTPDFTGRPTAGVAEVKQGRNSNIANMFVMPDGTQLAQYWDDAGTVRWTNDPDALFTGEDGVKLGMELTRDGWQLNVPVGGAKQYDPYASINAGYRDPTTADTMVNKVGRSSFAVWLNSTRTDKNDPGVAYAQDPRVTAQAITKELGVGKPQELMAALNEAEEARTDYLANTTDIDRRIRYAANAGVHGTVADQAAVAGYADMPGLARDVEDMYGRLRSERFGQWALQRSQGAPAGSVAVSEENERDELIRKALLEDPEGRLKLLGVMSGGNGLPPAVAATMRRQQTKGVVGQAVAAPTGQAAVVAQFKAFTAAQLGGVAGALAAAPRPVFGPAPGAYSPAPRRPSWERPGEAGPIPTAPAISPPVPRVVAPKYGPAPGAYVPPPPKAPPPPPGFNPTPINSGGGTFYVDPKTGRKAYV